MPCESAKEVAEKADVLVLGVKPQMLNIRNKRRNHQKNQHSRAQKHCTSVIVAPILEKKIPEHSWYISKPEQVRHDKLFTERYIIINVHMHYHILHIGAVLQQIKPQNVDHTEDCQRYDMLILLIIAFHCSPLSLPGSDSILTKNSVSSIFIRSIQSLYDKPNLLFFYCQFNSIELSRDLSVCLHPAGRRRTNFNPGGTILIHAFKSSVLSLQCKRDNDREFPSRHVIDHAQVEQPVLIICLRTKAKAAARSGESFPPQIKAFLL